MSSQVPLRIAYFAEIFPSLVETWTHYEIVELQKLGCTVRVFVTHPRPRNVPKELQNFFAISTYLPELPRPYSSAVARIFGGGLLGIVAPEFLSDAGGVRCKAQVVRDLIYTGLFLPFVTDFRPDWLLAHFAHTRTNLAMFCSALTGVPFAFKMHAADVFNRVALFRMKVERAARIMTISDYNIEFMRRNYPDIDVSRFQKHACGIPLNDYRFQLASPVSEVPTILGVGRLVRMKGFDVLIRASRALLDRRFRHRVTIVGDGPERAALESLCNDLGLRGTVSFKGYCGPNEVRAMLLASSVFVLPALWDPIAGTQDGIPVVLMEAMALGIPVVSTSTSGIPELVEDGVTGFLAPPNNHVALAAEIQRCCDLDTGSRETMLRAARRKVERNHNAQSLASALLDMLTSSAPSRTRTCRNG